MTGGGTVVGIGLMKWADVKFRCNNRVVKGRELELNGRGMDGREGESLVWDDISSWETRVDGGVTPLT